MGAIEQKTIKVIADLLEIDSNDISPDDSIMNDLGADALDHVEIIMNCEKEFGVEIPDDEAEDIDTVSDLIFLINSLLQEEVTLGLDNNKNTKSETKIIDDLFEACKTGDSKKLLDLISHGVDINSKIYRHAEGWTPLMEAVDNEKEEIVNILLSNGADVNAKREDGWTAIHTCTDNKEQRIAETLIKKGAHINVHAHDSHETPLMWAIRFNSIDIVKLFCAHGADLNAQDSSESTAIYKAIEFGNDDILKILVKSGANINCSDETEMSPLMFAIQNHNSGEENINNYHTIELLLQYGAEPQAVDHVGDTALKYAEIFDHEDIAELIKSHESKEKKNHKSNKNMETTISTPKKECKILIEGAVPEIYRLNAFRISGLNVNASTRDISNQVKKNQMMEKYGDATMNHNSPFPIEPSPDSDQINSAMHRLRDPETRLLDEFFWFWPHSIDSVNHDEALKLLSLKDINAAEKLWITQEATMTESNVSKHNLAVLAHLQALDFELNGKEATKQDLKNRDKNWENSFKRWKQLLDHEGFWSRLTARVRQMDDPRLTTGFVKRLRNTLPTAVLQINAQLALTAAENGNLEDTQRQLDLLHNSEFGEEDKIAALKLVSEPIRNKTKITCKKYATDDYPNPKASLNASKKLIEQTASMLKVLDILLPEDSAIREGAHDDVALEALGLLIDYGNKTNDVDLTESIKIYEDVLEIALGESANTRVKQNYEVVKRNHDYIQAHNVCFFCGEKKYDEKASISRHMHGEVEKENDYLFNKIRWRWSHKEVIVPRCIECSNIHNNKTPEHEQLNKLNKALKKYKNELNSIKDKKNIAVFVVLLAPIFISIALFIYAIYTNKSIQYGDPLLSGLNQLQILLYNNEIIYFVFASIIWIVGIITGKRYSNSKFKDLHNETKLKISDCETKINKKKSEIKTTRSYSDFKKFPEIIELKKEGWNFGKEPNMENSYY